MLKNKLKALLIMLIVGMLVFSPFVFAEDENTNDVELISEENGVPVEEREDNQSAEEIELRLNRLEYEESKIGMYDYVIKNDNLERTLRIIEEIIKT